MAKKDKDGMTVKATRVYFRFREKSKSNGGLESWNNISLDFSDAGE